MEQRTIRKKSLQIEPGLDGLERKVGKGWANRSQGWKFGYSIAPSLKLSRSQLSKILQCRRKPKSNASQPDHPPCGASPCHQRAMGGQLPQAPSA